MINDVLDEYTNLILQGNKDLFITEHRGLSFICKPLTYYQYQLCMEIEKVLGAPDSNEALLKMAVLYPYKEGLIEWLDSCDAAAPDIIADVILNESHLKDQKDIYELYKESRDSVVTNFMNIVQIYICTAFKSISPIDVEKMSMKDTMNLLIKAEELIGEQINIGAILGVEEQRKKPSFPIPPGMESTDLDPSQIDSMLDPANAGNAIKDAFGPTR